MTKKYADNKMNKREYKAKKAQKKVELAVRKKENK